MRVAGDPARLFTIIHEREIGALALLRLSGSLVDHWIDLVDTEVRKLLRSGYNVSLDCRDIVYLGPRGASMLQRLEARGVTLLGCRPLIDSLLHET